MFIMQLLSFHLSEKKIQLKSAKQEKKSNDVILSLSVAFMIILVCIKKQPPKVYAQCVNKEEITIINGLIDRS